MHRGISQMEFTDCINAVMHRILPGSSSSLHGGSKAESEKIRRSCRSLHSVNCAVSGRQYRIRGHTK